MATSDSEIFPTRISKSALIVLCRAPRLGQAKTRLAARLGAPLTCQLYRAMLRDCFDMGRALAPAIETIACFTPDDGFSGNDSLAQLWQGARLPQRGDDLGARMINGLSDARERGFERAIVIGSDAPDLPLSHLRAAFDCLSHNDVVVGPAHDGGFVLIGAARPVSAALFAGIIWSREDVFARLQDNLRALDWKFSLLQSWRDVDEIADLEALRARLDGADASVARATRAVLAAL